MNIGDKVLDFTAKDQYGNNISLSDFNGQKLILFFYPKALTSGCTNEVCNLADGYNSLKDRGYQLLGISADSVERQHKFSQKNSLPFSLLSDKDLVLCKMFGVWGQKKFMGKTYEGIHRKTFILDADHIVAYIIDKVQTKNHTQQILSILNQ